MLQIKPVQQLKDGSFVLTNNLSNKLIGEAQDKDAKLLVKSIASIHEGKHHRIYKLTLSTGKDLVLRIPYKLESDYSISQKIKSEVATLDFLSLKLGLNVPKVVAYGDNRSNALQTPFILMEYIEGDLLMKKWNPLAADSEETDASLKSVIQPISDFQDKILSVNSVSYTHLDVYKRQTLYCLQKLRLKLSDIQVEIGYCIEILRLFASNWEVSRKCADIFIQLQDTVTTPDDTGGPIRDQMIKTFAELNKKFQNAVLDIGLDYPIYNEFYL